MDTVTYVSIPDPATNISKDFAIITHADGSQTSMLKADYEASTLPSNSSIPQAGE